MTASRGLISGKVQGVWFRKSVQQGCLEIGLRGYARNLADGRVEVLLVGSEQQVARGRGIVEAGSPRSQVTAMDWCEVDEPGDLEGFRVL